MVVAQALVFDVLTQVNKKQIAQETVAADFAFGRGLRWYVLRRSDVYWEPKSAQPANRLNRRTLGGSPSTKINALLQSKSMKKNK